MWLGSTSDYIVRNSQIPVLIARDDTEREERRRRREGVSDVATRVRVRICGSV